MKTNASFKRIVELAKKSLEGVGHKFQLSDTAIDNFLELAHLIIEMDEEKEKE